MTIGYVLKRLGVFVLIVWITATINFVVPRLAPGDPVQAMLGRMEEQGAKVENSAALIAQYRALFGLDDPLWLQYLKYIAATARLQMGYSLTQFPATVWDIVRDALPYTLGLLTVTTLVAFSLGVLSGALLVWRGTPRAARMFIPVLMIIAPIPGAWPAADSTSPTPSTSSTTRCCRRSRLSCRASAAGRLGCAG